MAKNVICSDLYFPLSCCTLYSKKKKEKRENNHSKSTTILNMIYFIFLILFLFPLSFSFSESSSPSPPSASFLHSFFFHRHVSSIDVYILKISRTQILWHNFHLLVSNYAKINLTRNEPPMEESALWHLCQMNTQHFHMGNFVPLHHGEIHSTQKQT